MSKIKDTQTAKVGLSGMFGGPTSTPTPGLSLEEKPLSTKEEIEGTLEEETLQALQEEKERRQYLKAGRPPGSKKGSPKKTPDYVRMTFLITPEKQDKLREIALRKGLFLKELLDQAIEKVIQEYEEERV